MSPKFRNRVLNIILHLNPSITPLKCYAKTSFRSILSALLARYWLPLICVYLVHDFHKQSPLCLLQKSLKEREYYKSSFLLCVSNHFESGFLLLKEKTFHTVSSELLENSWFIVKTPSNIYFHF